MRRIHWIHVLFPDSQQGISKMPQLSSLAFESRVLLRRLLVAREHALVLLFSDNNGWTVY